MAASPIKRMTIYRPEYNDGLYIMFSTMCALEGDFKCGQAIANCTYTRLTDDEVDAFIHKMVDQLGEEAWQYFNENIYITSGG